MKFLYITLLALLVTCIQARAQHMQNYFDIDSYNHTLSYDGYKAVFRLQPAQKSLHKVQMGTKYAWFSGNRINWTQGGYSGKLLDGPYTEFYPNKGKKTAGIFDMGLKNGEWKSWTELGFADSVVNYSHGVLNGRFERYDKQGNLSERGKYHNGLINGKLEKFVSPDSILVTRYKNGKVYQVKPSWVKVWIRKIFKGKKQGERKPDKKNPKS